MSLEEGRRVNGNVDLVRPHVRYECSAQVSLEGEQGFSRMRLFFLSVVQKGQTEVTNSIPIVPVHCQSRNLQEFAPKKGRALLLRCHTAL